MKNNIITYRGRIAPTPTGHLHLGHAQTFWIAAKRAKDFKGKLIYRCEDLDIQRCKQEYHEKVLLDPSQRRLLPSPDLPNGSSDFLLDR